MAVARFAFLLLGLAFPGVYATMGSKQQILDSKQQMLRAVSQVSAFDSDMEAAQAECSKPQDAIVGVKGFVGSNIPQTGRMLVKIDPYLKVKLRKAEWQSSFKSSTVNPEWTGESKIFCVKQKKSGKPLKLKIEVWDDVSIFSDTKLGEVTVEIDKEKCANHRGKRGCTQTVDLSPNGGKLTFEIQMVDLAALRAANEKIHCDTLDRRHVKICKMIPTDYQTVFNPLGPELTTTQLDQGAKQSWYAWHTNQVNLEKGGMKTFDTPDDAQKCERWATAWFCAQAMPECVGSGQQKKVKQMCKSTCVNFFENCHVDGDLMARKNCQGLEEGSSCSAFDALIAGEKAQEMQAIVDSQLEQAFLDTVAETARTPSDKALPGVSYQSFTELTAGTPLVYGVWNVIPHNVDLDVTLTEQDGKFTLKAKGRIAITLSFWGRILTKWKLIGLNDYGTFTFDDPDFELSIIATHNTAKTVPGQGQGQGHQQARNLGQAAVDFEKAALALKDKLTGEYVDTRGANEDKEVLGWTANQVKLKLNLNLAAGGKANKWYLNTIMSGPVQWLFEGKLRKYIAEKGASTIAKQLTGTNAMSQYFGKNEFKITVKNHIKLEDPSYTSMRAGVSLEATVQTGPQGGIPDESYVF